MLRAGKVISDMSSLTNSRTSRLPDPLSLDSNSVENSNELTLPVSNATSMDETVQKSDSTSNSMSYTLTIKDLVARSTCSVRLTNAIFSATNLPAENISDYMKAPESMHCAFKSDIKNMGCKSADELDTLIRSAHKSISSGEFHASEQLNQTNQEMLRGKNENALNVARGLLSGLMFPQEVLAEDISVRLRSVLNRRYELENECFFKTLTNFDELSIDLLREPGLGQVSLHELTKIMESIIRRRLSLTSIDPDTALTLISGISRQRVDDVLIETLESIKPAEYVDVNWLDKELQDNCTLESIIVGRLEKLSEREREVMKRRFRITQQSPQTLQDIARVFDITRERVRQIEAKAKRKMIAGKAQQRITLAVESVNLVEKMFSKKKAISIGQLHFVRESLSSYELLAVNLCYGKIKTFLDHAAVKIQGGWVLDNYVAELADRPETLIGSTRQRLLFAILEGSLPLSVKDIADRLIDFTEDEVHDQLTSTFSAKLKDGVVIAAPGLPPRIRYILILKSKGRSLKLAEIRAANYEIFQIDESDQQIQSTLGRIDEALMVARGTYNLYDNLSLSVHDVIEIRNRVYTHLKDQGGFVSVKVIFANLFQSVALEISNKFNYYMLLGMLHDDFRFNIRRGLMVGLKSLVSQDDFLGLGEEAFAVLSQSANPMSLTEIAEALKERRDTFVTSISLSLDRLPQALAIGNSKYATTTSIFGDKSKQDELINCCSILLASGEKSIVAITEVIEPIFGHFPARAFSSFMKKFEHFMVERNVVYLEVAPSTVNRYLEIRDLTLQQISCPSDSLEGVRKALKLNSVRDFTYLDPMFISSGERSGQASETDLIDQILEDFEN